MKQIRRIQVSNSSRTAEAEVYPCGFADMVTWQRLIHTPHVKPRGGIGSDWDWPALFLGCLVIERLFGRQSLAFQIRVEADGGAVPVAQAILSMPYAWPGKPKHKRCVFVWFLMATPASALIEYGVTERFGVLPAVLDVAVQVSLSQGLEGRIGLHAAFGRSEQDSEKLVEKYQSCGLRQRRKRWWSFFRFPHRKDDGRLFYFTADDASKFAERHSHLR